MGDEEVEVNVKVRHIRSVKPHTEGRGKKICFISFVSLPIFSQRDNDSMADARLPLGSSGGAELQQGLLAEELEKNGYEVSFIIPDVGQKSCEIVNGIKLFKLLPAGFTINRNISIGRKLYLYAIAPFLIWNRLKLANSDIYFGMMVGESNTLVALFARLKGRKYVYSVSSDNEVDGTAIKEKNFLFAKFTKYAIRNADCIIAQSGYQQRLLKSNFNKDSALIKSLCILPDSIPKKAKPPVVLWVASVKSLKRPDLFLKLAQAIPDAEFLMIGGPGPRLEHQQYFENIKESGADISNLKIIGLVPYHEVNQYFDSASIFVNTSDFEGFPNTFLQAWARYVPVVSLNVDPDEIICGCNLGFHSKTFEQMVKDMRLLIGDEVLRKEMGERGRRYVEQEHDIKKVVRQYMELFERSW